MKFTKMHGIGNDYIFMNCMNEFPNDPADLSKRLSDRHFGIGSDGLICICPSNHADFKMRMFNSDGSEGAMCGNGIRCAAKFAIDEGVTSKRCLVIETESGLREVEIICDGAAAWIVKVDMGVPEVKEIREISVKGEIYTGTEISIGNPHFVVKTNGLQKTKVSEVGAEIESDSIFPNGVNVEFVEVIDEGSLRVRVWERGSGETLACGTGACAAVVAAAFWGYTDRNVMVHMPGGSLEICWDISSRHLFLCGPAVTVFEGWV